ncbi:tudor domain-containing protein 5 [Patella vulgata]|uniref:tudor domain-containing protein 5 n=1 Tax=Patella vulgata TaxID=6465 RepID=UPI0024A91806|nr:tudor domain-containing protein 5 [Patella vulgata]
MSQTAIRRAEVEKHIRAVLLSSPVGLTIQELRRDYNDFIGSPLPFRSFGYHDLEDYITDIPEILTVTWQDGKKVLRATADETTRHIEKLVSRQKVTNKNKWAVLRQKSNRPSYRSRYAPAPSVPVSIRQQIRQMFRHTKSLPLTHFDGFFYKRFGFHLDHEGLGFSTVKILLESIPDTVSLVNQYGEWRVLSAHRKVTPAKSNNPSPAKSSQPLSTTSTKPIPGQYELPPPLSTPEKPKNEKITPPVSPIKSCPVTPTNKSVSPPVDDNNYLGSSPEQDDYIDPIHQQLKQVLIAKPGIQASRLAFEFKTIIGKDLPFKDHGYHSVIEYVSDLPAIVRIERPNPSGDWLLYDATAPISPSEKTERINKSIPSYTGGRRVLKDVKEAISQVLQLHQPDGIAMFKFPQAFQDYTGLTIDPCSMGFASFESMLLSLTDDVLQATYRGRECVILSAKNTDEPRRFDQLLQKFQPHATPVPPHVQSYQEKVGLPEDCVLPRTYYTYQTLPEVTGEYIEVFISNIVSPGLFWLQLRGRRTTEALETLMDELSDFYMSSDSKRYKMPDCLYMIGQVCAVIFPEDNNWHRGIITGIKSMEIVEVYYVDYGNTCSVQKDTIRLLKTKFRRLPAQAIQARLANIKPVKEGWCLASRDRMLAICTNKPLVGFLTAVKNRVLSLCLTDTSQLEDIHLNDLLVEEKYAVFAPDELHPSTLGPTQFAEVPGDDILFGINNPSNNTPAVTDTITLTTNTEDNLSSSNPISPRDLPPGPRSVKIIDATEDHMFHLINLYGESYLLSAEISALFWHKDLLSSELIKKDMTCTKVKVIRSDHNDLFQELLA